jgi:hypothetical protein
MWAIGRASRGSAAWRGAKLPRLGRRNTVLLIVLMLFLLLLAWYRGGEEPVRLIEEDVAVPEGIL